MEMAPKNYVSTGFPAAKTAFRLHLTQYNISVEEPYYWVINFLKDDAGFAEFEKITDIFAGSLFSAFGSQQASKMSVVQDRASSFLATAGKMSKEIFQILRELRIIDEKLEHYHKSWGIDSKTKIKDPKNKVESSEVVLKGYWIDLVDGGSKSPTSVYGMSAQLGYGPLPDLFFKISPESISDVEKVVEREAGQFNSAVKMVLKRKLDAYLSWKEQTFNELETRRRFTIKYLKQHYQVIQMYLDWAKPYLKSAQLLKNRDHHLNSVDFISSFDSTLMEMEFLAKGSKKGAYTPVILMHFNYTSFPQGKYNPQYNQTEIAHMGRVEIVWRAYSWSDHEIYMYKKMRQDEDNELIGDVIGSMNSAMGEYGSELRHYIGEIGETIEGSVEDEKENLLKRQILNLGQTNSKKMKEILQIKDQDTRIYELEEFYKKIAKSKKDTWAGPLVGIISGFKEIGGAVIGKSPKTAEKSGVLKECPKCHTMNSADSVFCSKCKNRLKELEYEESVKDSSDRKGASSSKVCQVCYEKFKKAHRMVTW